MEKETRMLSCLIEKLEEVQYKLQEINNGCTLFGCFLTKDKLKSYTYMKNVLDLLVSKTTEGKDYGDDIALIYKTTNEIINVQPEFQNPITSEEYIEETKNLLNSTQKPDILLNYLLNFQELLGDILYSACQINNYQLKFVSGILVKDLVKVKNYYTLIWKLIASTFDSSKFSIVSPKIIPNEKSLETEMKIAELQKSIQLCLKEMSKVKLEIEHYFKFNIIELQFLKTDDESEKEENVESVDINKSDQKRNELFNLDQTHNLENNDMTNKLNTNRFEERLYKPPSSLFSKNTESTDYEESIINSYLFPPKRGPWKDWYNPKTIGKRYENVHKQPLIYPQNLLFFDPKTVFIQSKGKSSENYSLPRIYSVDSLIENVENSQIFSTIAKNISGQEENNATDVRDFEERKENNIENTSADDPHVENLFSENSTVTRNESVPISLQEKISSLINMLKTNQINEEEDIFDLTSSKVTDNQFAYKDQKKYWKENNLPLKTKQSNFTNNRETGNNHLIYNVENVDGENQSLLPKDRKTTCMGQCNINNYCYSIPCSHQNNIQHPVKLIPSAENNVIYDERSVIELFKTTANKNYSNSGSYAPEESSFCMWPVTADYIHVSKGRSQNKCKSVSSDNSISLTKSFEKSYFSLHLNKRYEQNKLYDGDLIVLEKHNRAKNITRSNYSLLNESYFLCDINQYGKKETVNGLQSLYHNEHIKSKNIKSYSKPQFQMEMSKGKRDLDLKKTMTVQYADCGDSFIIKNKDFKRKNFDFLKINAYNEQNNWNSFISIFTSNVGASTHINHHSMFRKIINNLGTESLPCNNLLSNVHTLTSNCGPFRLFDLNGYPLTDSAGNVLNDPYGKSVVQLDSTGYPKYDVKVFDAAGNSPNDINFDPTQKPKTNSIIIKLTDSFRRPLHLFDKYGRPLTDSNGKLLVNVHGRPLLRFDNFGRPNTDYRGGPLYTDNGFRWSYKTAESLLKNELSNETVIGKNQFQNLGSQSEENVYDTINIAERQLNGETNDTRTNNKHSLENDKIPTLHSTSSDIWIKVEKVLQQLPRKKTEELKTSKTSVIVNNMTIEQNPIEKELLKSIIYHDSFLQQDINLINETNFNSSKIKNPINYLNIQSNLMGGSMYYPHNQLDAVNKCGFLENSPIKRFHIPLNRNILTKNTCSKCFVPNQIQQAHFRNIIQKNILEDKNYDTQKPFILDEEDEQSKSGLANISTCHPENSVRKTMSNFNSKNYNYLNNLCNQIVSRQITVKERENLKANSDFINNRNWTETSSTELTSSNASKYTTEIPTLHDLQTTITDPKNLKKSIPDMKKVKDDYYSYMQKNGNNQYKIKSSGDHITDEGHFECIKEQANCKNINKLTTANYQNEGLSSFSEDGVLAIDVLNQAGRHYEINVAERAKRKEQNNIFNSIFSKKLFTTNSNKDSKLKDSEPRKKLMQNCSYKIKNFSDSKNEKNQMCSKQINEGNKDSPFRFHSETKSESTSNTDSNNPDLKSYHEVKTQKDIAYKGHAYLNNSANKENKLHTGENRFQNDTKYNNSSNNKKKPVPKNIYLGRQNNIPIKKPASTGRECNLVTFLGSPVKYVLNKLDHKWSSKPNSGDKVKTFTRPLQHKNYKENNNKNNNLKESINKNKQECKLNTLYDISDKKELLSSNEKISTNKKTSRELIKPNILAFHSKSCTEISNKKKVTKMSYSGGKSSSQSAFSEEHFKDLPSSSTELHKYSSLTNYDIQNKTKNPLHPYRKYETEKSLKRTEQYSFKSSMVRKKNKRINHSTEKNKKGNKKLPTVRYPKSFLSSSKNKTKEIVLFKKMEPKGKYILKRRK